MKLSDFQKTRCNLMLSGISIFIGLMQRTKDNPCETGCVWYQGGNCPDYKLLKTMKVPVLNTPVYAETNAQMAERLGITKRQASKMRRLK